LKIIDLDVQCILFVVCTIFYDVVYPSFIFNIKTLTSTYMTENV